MASKTTLLLIREKSAPQILLISNAGDLSSTLDERRRLHKADENRRVKLVIHFRNRTQTRCKGEQRFESHTDRLTNYIRYWQADGESQKTSIRTKTAMGQMVQEGRFRGGGVPYGYKLVPSGILNKRKHEVCKLEMSHLVCIGKHRISIRGLKIFTDFLRV